MLCTRRAAQAAEHLRAKPAAATVNRAKPNCRPGRVQRSCSASSRCCLNEVSHEVLNPDATARQSPPQHASMFADAFASFKCFQRGVHPAFLTPAASCRTHIRNVSFRHIRRSAARQLLFDRAIRLESDAIHGIAVPSTCGLGLGVGRVKPDHLCAVVDPAQIGSIRIARKAKTVDDRD